MNTNAKKFHESRRAFIIMRDAGLLVAPTNTDISHTQMLKNMDLYGRDLRYVLMEMPRGYCMNAELCLYQGFSGDTWKLADANYSLVQQYMPDLRALFNLNDNSNMYLGVRVGNIGDVWERINKTTIGEFMSVR